MKKILLLMLMLIAISVMTGCTAVDQALNKLGNDIEASRIESAGEKDRSGLDWSFVPVLREKATAMFTEAFPDYPVTDASVACKDERRVIVTLTYMKDGVAGKYGFDYKLGENGEYELDRYGDGVDSGDL
jgi:hypothetical protein